MASSQLPMGEQMPKVVATDLDGTLLRSDGSISPRTRAVIAAAEDAGTTVIFVTARPPRRLDEFTDVIGPHGVALCGNGAFVYDVARRAVTEEYPIPRDVLRVLTADLRAAIPGIVFAVECADGFGCERGFVYLHDPDRVPNFIEVDSMTDTMTDTVTVGKLLGRCDELDPSEFHERVAEVVADRAELGYSGAVGLAEITATGVTKAAGLARWCERNGVDRTDVWAFGDMPNDAPMLAWAGRSHAVGNAHPEVLALADRVVATNDDDAVAAALAAVLRAR